MAKYCGIIGFALPPVETSPGVYEEPIVKKVCTGDIKRNTRRLQSSSEKTSDDITISNQISILADPYVRENFHSIRYITFMGAKWKVSEVEAQYPRLILTLGGLYHGEQN